jgi:hypothetical protein
MVAEAGDSDNCVIFERSSGGKDRDQIKNNRL